MAAMSRGLGPQAGWRNGRKPESLLMMYKARNVPLALVAHKLRVLCEPREVWKWEAAF